MVATWYCRCNGPFVTLLNSPAGTKYVAMAQSKAIKIVVRTHQAF